ncbi:MAG: tRNA (guanosine(37)-N1)-methyltransferase TrmD [Lentisphaeria bacterium]|nr:tRNA (guanosine(37)-N1)-methyltransferase TrmD [Lentisphaeria bacterium]NQZ71237.1 tRNA (guanosine(37)-N1)-methyltransferase TrmD [Lentisphaeria bacterium]
MQIDIVTIFPEMFQGPFTESIVKRAQEGNYVSINFINPRDFTTDKHNSVDDRPYGGGAGMLMKAEPIVAAVNSVKTEKSYVILLAPQGSAFNQAIAQDLSEKEHLIFICGHYEGIDDRVRELLVDQEISIGDFVLTNGNLATMLITDAVVRLIPGVLGCDQSAEDESFSNGLLEYPQFTRPESFNGLTVPDVLLSGNHQKIAEWRHEQSLIRTKKNRPDLLNNLA